MDRTGQEVLECWHNRQHAGFSEAEQFLPDLCNDMHRRQQAVCLRGRVNDTDRRQPLCAIVPPSLGGCLLLA